MVHTTYAGYDNTYEQNEFWFEIPSHVPCSTAWVATIPVTIICVLIILRKFLSVQFLLFLSFTGKFNTILIFTTSFRQTLILQFITDSSQLLMAKAIGGNFKI